MDRLMPDTAMIADEYRLARSSGAVLERDDRALLEISGRDRAAWLHNLVTNAVKTLSPGDGNYAFATNVRGRVIFDGNILVLEEAIWFDLDARLLASAMKHFDRYIITEDVRLTDLTPNSGRIAVIGPRAADLVQHLGFGNLTPMAQLQHVGAATSPGPGGDGITNGRPASTAGPTIAPSVRMFRHDFTGLPGAEFIVVGEGHRAAIDRIAAACAELKLARISAETARVLRMEAGIPASVEDLDEDVVPPETLQVERGISYHKGCYLGQEVIERMRSHNILARRLVGLRVEGDAAVARNAPITISHQLAGRVTSCCHSPALEATLALGYIKSVHAKPGVQVRVGGDGEGRAAEVIALPVRR